VGAEYAFETAVSGVYDLSLWWTEYSNRSTEVPVEVYDGNMRIDTVFVDQTRNGGVWNRLGTYTFSGSARIVVISESTSATTCADAVKLGKK
jgi:hyaluronate lyase